MKARTKPVNRVCAVAVATRTESNDNHRRNLHSDDGEADNI